MTPDGETTTEAGLTSLLHNFYEKGLTASSDFTSGLILGLLIGEGHFGGDGKQPHVTLRMHVRHEPLLRWILTAIPGGKLYGPYNHGGRRYYQWMARGDVLKKVLLPLLDSLPFSDIDPHSYARYQQMKERYKL